MFYSDSLRSLSPLVAIQSASGSSCTASGAQCRVIGNIGPSSGAPPPFGLQGYGPLHNRSVAHTFLLAAFHSKFTGVQLQYASVPLLEPLSMSL